MRKGLLESAANYTRMSSALIEETEVLSCDRQRPLRNRENRGLNPRVRLKGDDVKTRWWKKGSYLWSPPEGY